jgi:hypothetical protein
MVEKSMVKEAMQKAWKTLEGCVSDFAKDAAEEYLKIPTLERRFSDDLDFHDVSVWSLKEALENVQFAAGGLIWGMLVENGLVEEK